MSAQANGAGRLRQVIEAAAARARDGKPYLAGLTVLSKQSDPYRLDTPAGHVLGRWFADQVERFVHRIGAVHLRGLHYCLVAAGDVLKPFEGGGDGKHYLNTDADWLWLQGKASSAGRWLGYVPFQRIRDERNAEPEVYVPEAQAWWWHSEPGLTVGDQLLVPRLPELPSLLAAMPGVTAGGSFPPARQPYRIVFIGEKSSLGEVLRPIAQRYGSELLLPTGEISTTMVAELAARAAKDGRPCAVLYFSDFDPAGHQMPISCARKLQALRDLEYPGLDVEVHPVCLTLDQVRGLDLPSTPLKSTEQRADHWRAVMGHEQTEIDALAALRPNALRDIVQEAIKPFYDPDLDRRSRRAEAEWNRAALAALANHPRYAEASEHIAEALDGLKPALAKYEAPRAALEEAADAVSAAQSAAADMLGDMMFPPVVPPGVDDLPAAPEPLFSTCDDFVTASLRLIARKALDGEGGP